MTTDINERSVQPSLSAQIAALIGGSQSVLDMAALPECLFLLNGRGEVIFANATGLEQICGSDMDAVRGCDWSGYFQPHDADQIRRATHTALGGPRQVVRMLEPSGPTGGLFTWQIAPILRRDGTADCLCALGNSHIANANAGPSESG